MKSSNLIFCLHWIAILVTLLIFTPKLDLLSFDNVIEAELFGLGLLGIIFFVTAHGMLAIFSPKTKTGIFLLVLGLMQIVCSILLVTTWLSLYHGEMTILLSFFGAILVSVVSLPFAIAVLVQRAKAKKTVLPNSF